jgi:hypothetical protein
VECRAAPEGPVVVVKGEEEEKDEGDEDGAPWSAGISRGG